MIKFRPCVLQPSFLVPAIVLVFRPSVYRTIVSESTCSECMEDGATQSTQFFRSLPGSQTGVRSGACGNVVEIGADMPETLAMFTRTRGLTMQPLNLTTTSHCTVHRHSVLALFFCYCLVVHAFLSSFSIILCSLCCSFVGSQR